jgi:hypothetical protein
MDSFADDLVNLRFMPGPLQSLYLNQDRVNERFNSHLGAITTWTRSVDREKSGGGDLKVVHGGVARTSSQEVAYGVESPVVRALLLREALEAQRVVRSPDSAMVGQYVLASGRSCLRHPEAEAKYPPGLIDHSSCIQETDERYEALELDRARAESVRLALAGPASTNERMWLLLLQDAGNLNAAAVLNSRWIDDAVVSYMHATWTMFGTLRDEVADVPLIAAIHVWVAMDAYVMSSVDIG